MPKNALATAARSTQSDTRGKILDLSAQIFRVRGYTDTTMNHIAEAAGIKAASIYYYFKSKDEIVEEVLNLGVEVVVPEGPPAEQREEHETAACRRWDIDTKLNCLGGNET